MPNFWASMLLPLCMHYPANDDFPTWKMGPYKEHESATKALLNKGERKWMLG